MFYTLFVMMRIRRPEINGLSAEFATLGVGNSVRLAEGLFFVTSKHPAGVVYKLITANTRDGDLLAVVDARGGVFANFPELRRLSLGNICMDDDRQT